MDRQTHIEQIRAACIRANPEKDWTMYGIDGPLSHQEAPVRLADILLAVASCEDGYAALKLYPDGHMYATSYKGGSAKWNLREDSLDRQSDEALEFISSLLKA